MASRLCQVPQAEPTFLSSSRVHANPVQVVRINPVSRPRATPELLQVGGGDRWGPRCRGLQGAERLASQHGHAPTHTHSDIRLPPRAGLNIATRSGVQGRGHGKESLLRPPEKWLCQMYGDDTCMCTCAMAKALLAIVDLTRTVIRT